MENEFELAVALQKLVRTLTRGNTIVDGVVTLWHEDTFTVDITINGTPYTQVPTNVLVGSQAAVYEVPVLNTKCLVAFRYAGDNQQPQILKFDQVDKLLINCQTLVQFNGGENGGMVLAQQLVNKINNIENLLNDLIAKFNSHTHPIIVSTGSGSSTPTTTQETGLINPITQPSDIENTEITQ